MNQKLRHEAADYPWGNTLGVLHSADWRICNLECVIADRGRPWSATEKVFHFRSDAKNIAVLKEAGINAVSIANNHVLDYEYDAMAEMLTILRKDGVLAAGAGPSAEEAKRVATWSVNGLRMGMVAGTDNEPDWEARAGKPGVFYLPIDLKDERAQELLARVRKAKRRLDFLIVSLHWGGNWGYEPLPEHVIFARALIDAGADLVFGHSPHVVRGIEIYRGKPVLYGAGDFIDDYAVDEIERNDRGFIFAVDVASIEERALVARVSLYPTVIRGFQAWHALQPERDYANNKMIGLCRDLGTHAQYDARTGGLVIDVGPFPEHPATGPQTSSI